MTQTSFPGNKGPFTAVMSLIVVLVGVTFVSVRMNLSAQVNQSQKEYSVAKVELEKLNQIEIKGIKE